MRKEYVRGVVGRGGAPTTSTTSTASPTSATGLLVLVRLEIIQLELRTNSATSTILASYY